MQDFLYFFARHFEKYSQLLAKNFLHPFLHFKATSENRKLILVYEASSSSCGFTKLHSFFLDFSLVMGLGHQKPKTRGKTRLFWYLNPRNGTLTLLLLPEPINSDVVGKLKTRGKTDFLGNQTRELVPEPDVTPNFTTRTHHYFSPLVVPFSSHPSVKFC